MGSKVRFTSDDLDLFAWASSDRHPLHTSREYAGSTAFGERVVYGVLAGLVVYSQMPQREAVEMRFLSPVYCNVDYDVRLNGTSGSLMDGERAVVSVRPSSPQSVPEVEGLAHVEGLPKTTAQGEYVVSGPAVAKLKERFGLKVRGLELFLWASYLVGMEMPGARALFTSLTLKIPDTFYASGLLKYVAAARSYDDRFGLLRISGRLETGEELAGESIMEVVVRQPVGHEPVGEREQSLAGKVGLVIGGSRGLGAAIVDSMAARGCSVIGTYRHSLVDAEQVVDRSKGRVTMTQSDASSVENCEAVMTTIVAMHGRLDFLICSESPPLQSLRIDANSTGRAVDFVRTAFQMVWAPLVAALRTLQANKGRLVLISSEVMSKEPPIDWPQYVAAKGAIEGLVRSASVQFPSVSSMIVRPPRLLTEMTNTPMSRMVATSPNLVAEAIASRLASEDLLPCVLSWE